MSGPAVYEIKESAHADQLALTGVWNQSGDAIAAGLTNLVQFPWDDGVLLLGQATNGQLQSYKLTSSPPFVTPITSNFRLLNPCDILKPFVIGGQQHLIAYRAQQGELSFHRVNPNLTLSKPYQYHRLRSPGLTTGWTLLQPLTYMNMVYYVTYDIKSGAVEMFNVHVTATSEEDVPPLQTLNVWSWTWAHGWTHFAFFEFGGENFFFKINVDTPNVNIDHLNLDPNLRSNEVCTQQGKQLPENQDPGLMVRSFSMLNGSPYLMAYLPAEGKTTCFRVNSDCRGWTQVAQAKTVADSSDIVTYRIGDRSFALFY